MNPYLIFFFGAVVGFAAGLIVAAMWGAKAQADHQAELQEAYQAGFEAGKWRGHIR